MLNSTYTPTAFPKRPGKLHECEKRNGTEL